MSALKDFNIVSEEDYLAGELESPVKHEYVAGRVYAMSGGTANHSAVASNFIGALRGGMGRKGCRTFTGDLSIRIEQIAGVSFFYPDASVVCAPIEGDAQFTSEPTVILEVLSPSTRRIDETSKLQAYLTMPSLQVCLLAESDQPFVRVYRRRGDQFVIEVYEGSDGEISLSEIQASLSLDALYLDVE